MPYNLDKSPHSPDKAGIQCHKRHLFRAKAVKYKSKLYIFCPFVVIFASVLCSCIKQWKQKTDVLMSKEYNNKEISAENPFFTPYGTPFGAIPYDRILLEHFVPAVKEGIRREEESIEEICNNDGLSFPVTVRNFRNSLFSNLGITQEARTLINDNLTISANFKSFVDAPSATDIMKWICQLNGVYGQYGRDKKFHYRELNALSEGTYPAEDLYPGVDTFPSAENAGVTINTSDYVSLTYEPYTTDYITKVVIIDGGGLDQGQAGVEGNTFIVQDNPIAFNVNMQSAARALLAKINVVNHIPVIKMKCVGLPYVECGDTFLSYTRKNICRSYVLQRTLSGIQALFDEYSSDSDKDYPPYKATTKSMTNADRKKILQIQSDIVRIDGKIIADEAEFNTLKSKAITTDNLSAQNISANQITAGTLNVDRIQAGSISAQKLNVSASDGNGWNVSMGPGGTSFSKGALGTGNITGSIGGGRGWGVNFGGYGESGSMSVGTLDAGSITTGTLDAGRISVDTIVAKIGSAQRIEMSRGIVHTLENDTAAKILGQWLVWKSAYVTFGNGTKGYINYLGHQ